MIYYPHFVCKNTEAQSVCNTDSWTHRSCDLFLILSQLPRLCFQVINCISLLWLREPHYRIWQIQNHCSKIVHSIISTWQWMSLGWEMKKKIHSNDNSIWGHEISVWQQVSFKFTLRENPKEYPKKTERKNKITFWF